jgi:hypothetical protein
MEVLLIIVGNWADLDLITIVNIVKKYVLHSDWRLFSNGRSTKYEKGRHVSHGRVLGVRAATDRAGQ